MGNRKPLLEMAKKLLAIQVGALVAGFALEEFLVPNTILDGGIIGLAIIASKVWHLPLGALVALLNIPFITLSRKVLGRNFFLYAIYAILSLSAWVTLFTPVPVLTSDMFLATVLGGILLGLGVGVIIRNGACLDGTEILAIIINRRITFSIGEIVMFFNLFIFGVAGLVFGVDRALYSIVAYLIAFNAIDLVVEGIDEAKALFVISPRSAEIVRYLQDEMKATITIIKGQGGYSRADAEIIYIVVKRLEVAKVKDKVLQIDQHAFITIHTAHEVIGKNVKQRLR